MVTATLVSLLPYFSCRRLIRLLFFSRDMYQNIQQMFPELLYGRDKHPFVRRVYSRQCRSEGNHVQSGIVSDEQETYESLFKNAPVEGSVLNTPDGKGTVTAVSVIKGVVSVAVENGDIKEIRDYKLKDIKVIKRNNSKREEKVNMAELKQLED